MKKIIRHGGIITLFTVIFTGFGYSQEHADAGRDTTILKGTKVTIGPSEYTETWCFTWSADSMHTISDKKAPKPEVSPSVTSTYKLQVVGPDFEFTDKDEVVVDVKNTKVMFKEASNNRYGFDNFYVKDTVWKSVKMGDYDFAFAEISPAEDSTHVRFKSINTLLPVRPDNASSRIQRLVFDPIIPGETEIQANFNSPEGENISKMNLASYSEIHYSLALQPVIEQKDDVQEIKEGFGSAYIICIDPGPDTILQSVKGGDDEKIGDNYMTTGLNGICETSLLGDDFYVIPKNTGQPNTECITKGPNNLLDTRIGGGDDFVNGGIVYTGPDGICETNAADSIDVFPTIDFSGLSSYLNDSVYNQAVISWDVYLLPPIVMNYDVIHLNDSLDKPVSGYPFSTEMRRVIDTCGDPVFFTKTIFLMVKGFKDDILGYMPFNQPFGFVFVDVGTSAVYNTIAHELGHSLGLRHTYELPSEGTADTTPARIADAENLMHPTKTSKRLRKKQWDQINTR